MGFGFLSKIFKNNQHKPNTSEIATIDTSFLHISKFKDLSEEEQKIVLNNLERLKLENYEDLVKYSDELVEKANLERELLLRAMMRYEEQYKDLEKKYKKSKIIPKKNIAIYVSNLEQVKRIDDCMCPSDSHTNIRYLMIPESLYNEFISFRDFQLLDYKRNQIIVVPDGTNYYELSNYLDQALENDKDEVLTLKNVI